MKQALTKLFSATLRCWISMAMRRVIATLLASAALLSVHGAELAPESGNTNRPFRLAFTASMFTDVNENDAHAAMKVWISTVAQERGIPVDYELRIFQTVQEMVEACRTNQIDGFGLVAPEYARLSQEMEFDRLAIAIHGGAITEEYVLLVHQDSGLEQIEQLRGRSLNVLVNPRMSLGLIWLDTLLLEARQGRAAEFFGKVASFNKTSRVALPVFFRQADACLMTRDSFKVMGELNPQLNQKIRILAASPAMVPSCFAFRKNFVSSYRPQLLAEMSRLGDTPVGQQILMLTQSERIEEHPVSCLDSALKLIATHERLCDAKDGIAPGGPVHLSGADQEKGQP